VAVDDEHLVVELGHSQRVPDRDVLHRGLALEVHAE
jgi:hypothetical protein